MKTTYQIISIILIACMVNALPGGGIHDYLPAMSREELEKWALAAEVYHKIANNQQGSFGGLHDYINTMTRNDLVRYIIKEAAEHPEINSAKAFNSLVEKHNITVPNKHKFGGDGGLSSMLWRTDKETLIKWAFACERYHNNGQELIGGLHDYIYTWGREELLNYIRKETKEHDELNHLGRLNQLAGIKTPEEPSEGVYGYVKKLFGGSPVEKPFGGLHDYIYKVPREKLESWALAAEDYHRAKMGGMWLGGIHDYIWYAKNEEIANYILDMAKKYPELNSIDKLNELSEKREEQKGTSKMGGLHDYIFRVPKEQLKKWAMAIETYIRLEKGEDFDGGIHDYVNTATNEELVKYILMYARKYPELNSSAKLNEIVEMKEKRTQKVGGLHDYIFRVPREKLVRWALFIEHYVKTVKKQNTRGGIHDYIATMKKEDIIKYILENAKKYEELDSAERLDSMLKEKDLSNLKSFIYAEPKEKLVKWALACEKFVREVKKVQLIGGIHDYINTATKEQIAEYILQMAGKYEELDSAEKLNSILETKEPILGGLHDYIYKTPKKQLQRWALATEKYVRSIRKKPLLGGIHDYINTATIEQMGDYILKMAAIYEELNSGEKLEKLAELLPKRAIGGLHDYIFRVPREKLAFWALGVEHYVREIKQVKVFGGIHDYINVATTQQLVEYILERADKYPELNSEVKLDEVGKLFADK